jgi:hypothetical protein
VVKLKCVDVAVPGEELESMEDVAVVIQIAQPLRSLPIIKTK